MEFSVCDLKMSTYNSYEDYLDSLIRPEDHRYLKSKVVCRLIASLGYTASESLTRDQFNTRKNAINEYLHPTRKPYHLFSSGFEPRDEVIRALAARERANRVHMLATIIYIRKRNKRGHEVSGYIDYTDSLYKYSLRQECGVDWMENFAERQTVSANSSDLSFYNSLTGQTSKNDTLNFRVITDPKKGLTFIYRMDRRAIFVNPNLNNPGISTTRNKITSNIYKHVVLFDHVPRSKIWQYKTWLSVFLSVTCSNIITCCSDPK